MYYDPSTPRASTTPGLAAAPAASASADRLDPPNNGVPSGVAVEGAGGLLEAIAAFGQVLTGVDVAQAHPSQLYGLLQALATVTNQLNATQVAAVAAADRSGQWAVDRTRSLNTWVQLATRSSVAAAGTKIGAARVSTHIPETMAAFTSGDTTLEHVSMIARAATASPARVDVLSDLDPIVADLCTHVRPRQLGTALAEWSHRVDAITMTEEYASETVRRFFDTSGEHGEIMKAANVPPSMVIIQRINLGLYAILGQLDATANWRQIAEELWPWVERGPTTPLGEAEAAWRSEVAGR